jgi:hypothetical protein
LGLLFAAEHQTPFAIPPLTRACELLDVEHDASLARQARHALAACHARLERPAAASPERPGAAELVVELDRLF